MSAVPEQDKLDRFRPKTNWPFLLGAYMATNAVRDAYLLIDAPDCAFFKAEHVQGNHDRASTLLDCEGHHRIVNTRADVGNIIDDRRTLVQGIAQVVYDDPGTGAIVVTSMPMAMVTGVEYGLLVRTVQSESDGPLKPAIELPCASLAGDWYDGYADFMTHLCAGMDLQPGRVRPGTVAFVGNLVTRVEADCLANADELRRTASALGLETVSVWLDGGDVASLRRLEEAELIVSLPAGEGAAREAAEVTGAQVVSLKPPVGLEGTRRFVEALGAAAGRESEAAAFIDAELTIAARRLQWVLPLRLTGRRFVISADPFILPGLLELLHEVGARVPLAICYGRPEHIGQESESVITREGTEVLCQPSTAVRIRRIGEELSGEVLPDLFIGNGELIDALGAFQHVLELGYPSYRTDILCEAPFVGFRGALWLLQTISNRIGLYETLQLPPFGEAEGKPEDRSA